MTQEKMRKVIAACVSAATVLFVFLLSYLVYQWVTLAVLDKREKELQAEIQKLEQTIEKGTEEAEYYESVLGKNWLAIHQGWQAGDEEE
jgi:cell division protein FtsB